MDDKVLIEMINKVIHEHLVLLKWLSLGSLVTFCATPLLVLLIVVNIPADYFADSGRKRPRTFRGHPIARLILVSAKNILGLVCLLAGLLLLFIPGQGLLTILIGVMLLDFPGKYRLESRLIAKPGVHRSINHLRQRFHKPPLVL